jgi:type II secretory pathway component HofQ
VRTPPRKAQPTVTLDVKDADIRVVLKSMQKQCGIKNLLLDNDVQGTGTFLFRALPCRTAFDVVFKSAGLAGTLDGAVVSAAPRR